MRAAAARAKSGKDDIKGIVLFNPAYDLYNAFTRKFLHKLAAWFPWITERFFLEYLNKPWILEGTDIESVLSVPSFYTLLDNVQNAPKLGHYVKDIDCPVLIFHGTKDPTVPFKFSERLERELIDSGKEARLVPLEGAKHNPFVSKEHASIMLDEINKFTEDLGDPEVKDPLWRRVVKPLIGISRHEFPEWHRGRYVELAMDLEAHMNDLAIEAERPPGNSLYPPGDL
jgi:alpha-beta hydrolase superfamily lysophospholipase